MYLDQGGTAGAILLLLLAAAGFLFWNDSLRARERMLETCARLCRELKVQFLDESVVLTRLTLGRGGRGWPQFIRVYSFEFSGTGQDRWQGRATLAGRHVLSVQLDHPEGVTILGGGRPMTSDVLRLTRSASPGKISAFTELTCGCDNPSRRLISPGPPRRTSAGHSIKPIYRGPP